MAGEHEPSERPFGGADYPGEPPQVCAPHGLSTYSTNRRPHILSALPHPRNAFDASDQDPGEGSTHRRPRGASPARLSVATEVIVLVVSEPGDLVGDGPAHRRKRVISGSTARIVAEEIVTLAVRSVRATTRKARVATPTTQCAWRSAPRAGQSPLCASSRRRQEFTAPLGCDRDLQDGVGEQCHRGDVVGGPGPP